MLFGGSEKKETIDDAFTARKRAEIEAEKAQITGASTVKNRLKTFGAQLDANERARSTSPLPRKTTLNDETKENERRTRTPKPLKLSQRNDTTKGNNSNDIGKVNQHWTRTPENLNLNQRKDARANDLHSKSPQNNVNDAGTKRRIIIKRGGSKACED